jgi:hypothetical protein
VVTSGESILASAGEASDLLGAAAEFFPIALDAPLDFGGVVVPAFLVRQFGTDG